MYKWHQAAIFLAKAFVLLITCISNLYIHLQTTILYIAADGGNQPIIDNTNASSVDASTGTDCSEY